MKTFGQKLEELRKARGLSQEELGKLVGIQKSAISKYERGRIINASPLVIEKFAEALDVKAGDLLSDLEKQLNAMDVIIKTDEVRAIVVDTVTGQSVTYDKEEWTAILESSNIAAVYADLDKKENDPAENSEAAKAKEFILRSVWGDDRC